MNRELCEWYKNKGLCQVRHVYTHWVDTSNKWRLLRSDELFRLRQNGEDPPAFGEPTIEGLLAFLREKLPQRSVQILHHPTATIVTVGIIGLTPLGQVSDPDPTTALALAGKAALEASE